MQSILFMDKARIDITVGPLLHRNENTCIVEKREDVVLSCNGTQHKIFVIQ